MLTAFDCSLMRTTDQLLESVQKKKSRPVIVMVSIFSHVTATSTSGGRLTWQVASQKAGTSVHGDEVEGLLGG